MTYGEITTRVIDAHMAHPDWTAQDIATFLNLNPASVRSLAGKVAIRLPSERLNRIQRRAELMGTLRKPFIRRPYAGKSDGDNNKW